MLLIMRQMLLAQKFCLYYKGFHLEKFGKNSITACHVVIHRLIFYICTFVCTRRCKKIPNMTC